MKDVLLLESAMPQRRKNSGMYPMLSEVKKIQLTQIVIILPLKTPKLDPISLR